MMHLSKFGLVVSLVVAVSLPLLAKPTKMFEVESGVVEYVISGGGSMMGIKTSTKGSKTVSFKDWGNVMLDEESITEQSGGEVTKEKSLVKYDNGMVYAVNFDEKVIMKMDAKAMAEDKSILMQSSKEAMQQMGGKQTGKDSVLGYTCEVWEFQWGKVCSHKGIPLKTSSTMMGITHNEIATKVNFGVNIPSSKFILPNYPMTSMNDMTRQSIGKATNGEMSPEQMQDLMKNLGGMFGKQ